MIDLQFVPVDKWPTKERVSRKSAPFRVTYAKRLDLLEEELKKLGAKGVIVQAFFTLDQIRNDGWPRSNCWPSKPGVIVTFQNRKKESLSFPCDTYQDWQDNLYAIALSLEALRSVDRYGVTQREEQYEGWKRLAAPESEQKRGYDWAVSHICALANTIPAALKDPASLDLAYRAAARRTHPDSGGNTEAFQMLQDAMRLIRGVAA